MRISLVIAVFCVFLATSLGRSELVKPTDADRALAARTLAAAKAAIGTCAQEQANFILNDWPGNCVKTMQSTEPVEAGSLHFARSIVDDMLPKLESGPSWPAPPTIRVPHTRRPPQIDGKLDDQCWASAVTFTDTYKFNTTVKDGTPATTWKLLWDRQGLYFAFTCADADIQAPALKRDAAVFNYDAVEMFILPEWQHGLYWELVIGPTGAIFDALHAKKFKNWGPISREDENLPGLQVGYQVTGTPNQSSDQDTGYVVEVAVPFRGLPSYTRGNAPVPGDILHLMLARMDKNGDKQLHYAFCPLLSWGHNIWNHARVELMK